MQEGQALGCVPGSGAGAGRTPPGRASFRGGRWGWPGSRSFSEGLVFFVK